MNFKQLISLVYQEKDKKGYKIIAGAAAAVLFPAVLLTLFHKEQYNIKFLNSFRLEEDFPVYVFMSAILLALPAYNISKNIISRFSDRRGALALLPVLILYVGITIIPQIFLPGTLPLFTDFLQTSFLVIALGFLLYITVKEMFFSKEMSED
jgi:hypothetical protein